MDDIDTLLRQIADIRLRVVNGHRLTRDAEDRVLYKLEELKTLLYELYGNRS